jgi:hypothetical protein
MRSAKERRLEFIGDVRRERLLELELEHWPHMERGMTGDREDGWNSQEK